MNEIRASRQLGKQINRKLVLNLIKAGPTSRAEIAEETGLSPATVSNLTFELIEEGLVHETGVVETSRGRPPVLLRINSQARYVVGVKVMPHSLVAVVTDLDANVVAERTLVGLGDADDLRRALHRITRRRRGQARTSRGRRSSMTQVSRGADLLGVGVGLAGIIDSSAGDLPLLALLRLARRRPRDAAASEARPGRPPRQRRRLADHRRAVVRAWPGHRATSSSSPWVVASAPASCFNGRFYGGYAGGVGELAHVTVAPDGPACAPVASAAAWRSWRAT